MTREYIPRIRATKEEMIKRADRLYDCLPCSSLDLPRKLGMSPTEIMAVLRFIRSMPVGRDDRLLVPFTVPHGKRGRNGSWYFAVLINDDRSYYIDRHNLEHIEDGTIGTLREMASKLLHHGRAVSCFAAGMRQSANKWYMEDCARTAIRQSEDIEHFLRRVEQAYEEREERAA